MGTGGMDGGQGLDLTDEDGCRGARRGGVLGLSQVPSQETPLAGISAFLELKSLRALSVCEKSTSWETLIPHCGKVMQAFLRSSRARVQASRECPWPTGGWTEESPECAAPLCERETGLWIPSAEEFKRITGTDRFEFPCGTSV